MAVYLPRCTQAPVIVSSFLAIVLLAGCASSPPRKDATAGAAPPAPIVPTFPFPAQAGESTDETCQVVEAAVRAGVALEDDVWTTVLCLTERLPPTAVEPFLKQARAFRSDPESLVKVDIARLPAELRTRLDDAERAGKTTVVTYVAPSRRGEFPELRQPSSHLGPGSWRSLCLPWTQEGHYEATAKAGAMLGGDLSPGAIAVLADASQDPDFFDWRTMAAHGQTPLDGAGKPQDAETAQQAFRDFIRGHVDSAAKSCAGGDLRSALYFTGYALHAVEDLAPHRGRTNEEHAYNAYVENKNPDREEAAFILARDLAASMLRRLLKGPLHPCAQRFASYSGAPIVYAEKVTTFKRQRDLTVAELRAYKRGQDVFKSLASDQESRVRWFGRGGVPASCDADKDCKKLFDSLLP